MDDAPSASPGPSIGTVPIWRRLSVRISVVVVVALVLAGALILGVDSVMVRDREAAELHEHAEKLAGRLARGLGSSMVRSRRAHVSEMLTFVSEEKGVIGAHVLSAEGEFIFSSEASLQGTRMALGDAGCVECHSGPAAATETGRVVQDPAGERFRYKVAVANGPQCVRCHQEDQEVLGLLVVDLSTDRMKTELRNHFGLTAVIVFITVLVAVLAVILVMGWFVWRPLKAVLRATDKVEAGDLSVRVRPTNKDELGLLGAAFDRMVERLEGHTRGLEATAVEATAEAAALDRSLREIQAQLMRTNRLATMGEMAAAVAHEVRTPLNALGINLHILRKRLAKRDPEEVADVERIAAEIKRIDGVIDRFLTVARFPPPNLAPLVLNSVVDTVLAVMEPEGRRGGVRFVRDYASPSPQVRYDEDRLRHVLFNLVLNAIQAMAQGGTLTLRTRAEAPHLELEDTGPGVPEDLRDLVFKPFYSTKEKGTGLGLAIASRMLRETGASLRYVEREGCGAVFAIDLPAEEEGS